MHDAQDGGRSKGRIVYEEIGKASNDEKPSRRRHDLRPQKAYLRVLSNEQGGSLHGLAQGARGRGTIS